MNLNIKALGSEIKYLRKELGLSQQNLAENVCSQSEISRIEKGEILPRVDNFYQIAVKLRVDVPYLFFVLLREKNEYIDETIKDMILLKNEDNYKELYEWTKEELKRPPAKENFSFGQFLKWHYYIAAHETKQLSYKAVIQALKKLVSTKNFMIQNQFQDFQIKNSIAVIHAQNKAFDKSIPLYGEILSTDLKIRAFDVFKTKAHYNYSKMLCDHESYASALGIVNQGIELSTEINDLSMLGNLYFQKGVCYDKLGYLQEEILNCFKKAKTVFEIQGNQRYIEITHERMAEVMKNS